MKFLSMRCGEVPPNLGHRMLQALRKIVWFRSVWVAVIGVLVHYHYTSTNPNLVVWEGHVLLVSWVLLQCFLLEVTLISFKSTPANQIDPLDVILAVLLGVCFAATTLTIGVDMLPTNSISHIYTTHNVLPAYQCDSIIRIAENHARMHLQDILAAYEEINATSAQLRESVDAARELSLQSGGWLTDRHAKYPTTDMAAYSIRQNITLFDPDHNREDGNNGTEAVTMDFVRWLNSTVENTIFPILRSQYDLTDPEDGIPILSLKDLFIVKYSAESPHSQRHLELHTDSSQISFNIALSTHLPDSAATAEAGRDVANAADSTSCSAGAGELDSSPSSEGFDVVPHSSASGQGAARSASNHSAYTGGGTYILRSGSVVHTAKGAMLSHPSRIHHAGAPITAGTRYLLVGFVNVRRYTRRTFYRRHGMFSRCVSFSTYDASGKESAALGRPVLQDDPAALFADTAGPVPEEDLHCQWYLWVLAYDLAEIVKQPFLNARKSARSAVLAVVLGITVLAAALAVISACALFFTAAAADRESRVGKEAAKIIPGNGRGRLTNLNNSPLVLNVLQQMSKHKHPEAEDIWSKLQKNPPAVSAEGTAESSSGSSLVFVGDLSSGKSTLIQSFLKPSAAKDTKPTIALEYNFARKTTNNSKSVANLWEIGGDLVEPKLMEIGITLRNLPSAVVIIVCDLSKPHNILNSVLRSISAVKETATKRVAELQATNVNQLNEIRERLTTPYKGHPDEARVRPLDVTVCIVANKHDMFKSLPSADRRNVIQVLRFVAHFFGAHLITTSTSEVAQREAYRGLITSLAFGAAVKPTLETNPDKLVYITRGMDSFQKIFLEHAGEGDALRGKGLAANEAEMGTYITHKGVTRDCWSKLSTYMTGLFGEADPLPTASLTAGRKGESKDGLESGEDGGDDSNNANPFPEAEIDDMRAVRDAALARYIQEAERKEELLAKMNARGGTN